MLELPYYRNKKDKKKMTTTDTPQTDAMPSELEGITNDHVIRALRIFGKEKMTKDERLESWINLGADRLEKAEAEVEKLYRELAEARSLIIESKKMHDYIRKLLSFVYMELPAHDNTKKFVHQYFNEIQS